MGEIASAIFKSEELKEIRNWIEVSVVFEVNDDGKVDGTYGYAYDESGAAIAIAPRPREVRQPVSDYREWLRQEGDKGFIKMLFQFNRVTRKVNADFEYDDHSRWQVTPNNLDRMIKELCPDLGD